MNLEEWKARMERLEGSVAHLERLADQLNEALIDQGRQITRLNKRLDLLGETMLNRDHTAPLPPNERPPHYGR